MSVILLLGGGTDAVEIIKLAKKKAKVIVMDANADAPATKIEDIYFIVASCYDVDAALEVAGQFYVNAVLCAGTDAVRPFAAVAHLRGLIGPSISTANYCYDKHLQISLFKNNGINVPNYSTRSQFVEENQRLGITSVAKPHVGRGARGVSRIRPEDNWLDAYNIAAIADPMGKVLFQEWIDGLQLSSESIVRNGKVEWTAYSERNYEMLEKYYPYIIENGGDCPAMVGKEVREQCHEQLQKSVDALAFMNGTLKGDLVYTGGRVYVIEVAPRLSGGKFCSVQIPYAYGFNLADAAIDIALGIETNFVYPAKHVMHCSQRFDFPATPTKHPDRGISVHGIGATRLEAQEDALKKLRLETE